MAVAVADVGDFDIPPQALASALDAYGAQTGVQLLYNSALAAGRSSPGVKGRMGQTQALQTLLAGSGLVARYTDGRAKAFVLAEANAPATTGLPPVFNGPVMALDTIHVEGPPVIKASGNHDLYARFVQSGIQSALHRDTVLRRQVYAVSLHVWVGATGRLDRAEVFGGAGDQALDRRVLEAIRGLAIAQPPPADLPQPIHVLVAAQAAATNGW